MIDLDFQPDERELAEDAECDPATADPAVLQETYFVMPVRFAVDGIEVLGMGEGWWWRLPLLGFATSLASRVRPLREHGHAEPLILAGGGDLVWQLRGDVVEVRSTLSGRTVTMSLTELEPAVAAFLERVRQFILSRFPLMATHPNWPHWFGVAPSSKSPESA